MIKVNKVTKYYGQRLAVKDIEFEVGERRVVGLLGPNGAGKTTILRILTCYLPPSSGNVVVAGYDSEKEPLKIREKIGFMPENVPLYGELSVWQFLGFVADSKSVPPRQRRSEISRVISLCGLERQENRLIRHLSKGQRQRVGLAQALLGDPPILILDEPTAGLDPAQVLEVRELIKELGKDKTVILSTHILPEASQVSDEVIIINNGRIVAQDTLQGLTMRLKESNHISVIARLEANPSQLEELKRDPLVLNMIDRGRSYYEFHISSDPDSIKLLAQKIVDKKIGLLELRPTELNLEEIFIRLVVYGEDDSNRIESSKEAI